MTDRHWPWARFGFGDEERAISTTLPRRNRHASSSAVLDGHRSSVGMPLITKGSGRVARCRRVSRICAAIVATWR
ncbi:hypothetical protein WME75_33205 [Sorangium sp. So ce1014]|uniref:hypothetical protein n=1 Tax=Sorangium sp. So ce1014 TaxID=3133326 RepID=UPI003F60DC66